MSSVWLILKTQAEFELLLSALLMLPTRGLRVTLKTKGFNYFETRKPTRVIAF